MEFSTLKTINVQIVQQQKLIYSLRVKLAEAMGLESDLIERGRDTGDVIEKINAIEYIYFESLKKLEELNQQKEKEMFTRMKLLIPTLINALNKENIVELMTSVTVNDINETLNELEFFNRIGDKSLGEGKDDVPF
ncbi:hypothetical protein MZM54_02950 [[Brevibacterium] frigoritolerans]|nr:hypothetical protein [Peribacillus frigoritolerans]